MAYWVGAQFVLDQMPELICEFAEWYFDQVESENMLLIGKEMNQLLELFLENRLHN